MRFPEFTEEWERKRFNDVCNITTGNKNTQDKSNDGIYPFYVRSQIVERINSWTFDGEAILTAGDGVGVGKVFHYSTGKIGVHQRVYILSDFKCDGKYLYSYFAGNFYNRVKRMSAKNSVDSVRMEMIADMPISLPSMGEQKKIGHLLTLLDQRIATQNKIIEKLESLIKGIRQHIFSDITNGTTSSIGTYLTEYNERNFGQNLKPAAIGRYGIRLRDDIYSKELASDYSKNKVIRKNTLTIGMGSKQIDIGILSDDNAYCVSPAYSTFMIWGIRTDYLREYLAHLNPLLSNLYMITSARQGKSVNKDEFLRHRLVVVSDEEQQKVVDIFHVLHQKYNAEQEYLNAILKQKQYLLRQMFI